MTSVQWLIPIPIMKQKKQWECLNLGFEHTSFKVMRGNNMAVI